MSRTLLGALVWGVLAILVLVGMKTPISGGLSLSTVIDPWDGFWRTARQADRKPQGELHGRLDLEAEIVWDERGVPHIFADTESDAITAFGYVVAQDRLFQMDFLRRVTAGRLAEVLGPDLVATDRFLRATGMSRAVSRNVERMRQESGVDYDAAVSFARGVNAYLGTLGAEELPFEFRLLGYAPEEWKPMDSFLVGWNLIFDLTYQREAAATMDRVRAALTRDEFDFLFPEDAPYAVPIVHAEDRHWSSGNGRGASDDRPAAGVATRAVPEPGVRAANGQEAPVGGKASGGRPANQPAWTHPAQAAPDAGGPPSTEGFFQGKGSNNWAVGAARSTTGAPVLAGDMHLSLSLPAIWYEVHMVTPEMDTYGVTVPGVPLPIEAFTPTLGWAFTNTGSDQIDHLRLELDDSRLRYRYEGQWEDLELVVEPIVVKDSEAVMDTVRWSRWGPVTESDGEAIATQWTGHGDIRTFQALWEMNHARTYADFEQALRFWDAPMQNILVAAPGDTIAIRSTGWLPIRADGSGYGVRDGSTSRSAWIGRVPFEDLPHAINPDRAYLSSTNQRPADATYPHYLGRNWGEVFRSLRIDELLRSRPAHTPEQVASYQADVKAVQRDLFVPLLDSLDGLSPRATAFREALKAWDGTMGVNLREPVLFAVWDGLLQAMAWDEEVFRSARPERTRLHALLAGDPGSKWLDIRSTEGVEDARGLLRASLEAAADSVSMAGPPWGDVHGLVVRHITGSAALRPLWRGPYPYPGFAQTLSPGSRNPVTFSASWRVVLDLQGDRTSARGVYPGGQNGNPFSRHYDDFIDTYVAFNQFPLHTPGSPDELTGPSVRRLHIRP